MNERRPKSRAQNQTDLNFRNGRKRETTTKPCGRVKKVAGKRGSVTLYDSVGDGGPAPREKIRDEGKHLCRRGGREVPNKKNSLEATGQLR